MDTHPARLCMLEQDTCPGPSDLLILEDKKQELRWAEEEVQETEAGQHDK